VTPHRVHLDTDLGSDTDDLCALAMLLGWENTEVVGITTNTDPGGIRAGYIHWVLGLIGRDDIAVRVGAEGSLGGLFVPLAFPDYWPEPIHPRPGPPGAALDLLCSSAESGATIVAIGPYTNLALLEASRPGLLAGSDVVVMGGHVTSPAPGLPQWGVHDDFNVQQDRTAADIVFERCRPVVVPIAISIEVFLRASHTERLRAAGPLGRLLADQAEAHARDNRRSEIGRAYPALPDDLLNFQYDPLACAVALGWDGALVETIPTMIELHDERLWMMPREDGLPLRVVTEVDAPRFEESWLAAIENISASPSRR
jgi:purine nucleosidase